MLRSLGYGKPGPSGKDGANGKDGTSATVRVGTVTTGAAGSSAVVSNSGTNSAAVLDFTIPRGASGVNGTNGTNGQTPTIAIGTVSTLAAGSQATASVTGTTPSLTLNLGIPAGTNGTNGTNGSNATATPLATIAPKPLASTAAVGTSSNAAREDHVHPFPSGRLELIGNVTVAETTLLSLALGMKRMALTLTGVAAGDRLTFAPTALATAGCEAVNVYASGTNQVTVSYFVPALSIGASYSIPLAVYRIT